jgi:hypothetical protein
VLFKTITIVMLMMPLIACSLIDRQANGIEQIISKQKSCEMVSQGNAPDYSSTQRYRCTGRDCHDYGCHQ